jgi:hypothetical protein
VLKIGHAFDPVEDIRFQFFGRCANLPGYEPGKVLVCNESNPMIACYTEEGRWSCNPRHCYCDDFTGMLASICFDPDAISNKPEGVKRELEFIKDPPITLMRVEVNACDGCKIQHTTLCVRGGIQVRDLRECFEKMKPSEYKYGRVASLGVLGQEYERFSNRLPIVAPNSLPTRVCWWHLDDCSPLGRADFDGGSQEIGGGDGEAKTILPSAQDDPSESGDESDGDSVDESDAGAGGAGGAGMAGSSEPDDGDKDDDSEGDDAGGSSQSGGGSEDGDSKSGEDEQVGASNKVLQTNELLQMILAKLPQGERTSLRRVSKTWQGAVEKIGHAVEPSEYEPSRDDRMCDLPMHSPQITFKHNLAFYSTPAWMDLSSRVPQLGGRIWCQCLSFHPLQAVAQLAELENGFITDPPITQAKIHSRNTALDVLLQIPEGIRIRDLVKYFPNLGHIESTRVSVLFGDQTRRAKADKLFPLDGNIIESSDSDDDSYGESEEDCEMSE